MRIPVKVLLWSITSLLFLLVVVVVLLQMYWFQNLVVDKVTTWLSAKIESTVTIQEIGITFPKEFYLKDLFIADRKGDTLLFVRDMKVDISMWSLLKKQAILNSLQVNGLTSKLYRSRSDNSFNFEFIMQAFDQGQGKPAETDSVKNNFDVVLKQVSLEQISVTLRDEVGGIHVSADLGHLDVVFDRFSLLDEMVSVDELNWSDSRVSYVSDLVRVQETAPASPVTWKLSANRLNLANLDLFYSDTTTRLTLDADITTLKAQPKTIDLAGMEFNLQSLLVEHSSFDAAIGETMISDTLQAAEPDAPESNLMVRCEELDLQAFDFRFDNKSAMPVPSGMDYNHLHINDITGQLSNIFYQGLNISADVSSLQASEKCGFTVKEASGEFRMTETGVLFDKCLLVTGNSIIRNSAGISYRSLEEISKDIGKLGIRATMVNAKVAVSDLLYFYPPLADIMPLKSSLQRTVIIDGKMTGSLDNLLFTNLSAKSAGTVLSGSGSVRGLPDVNRIALDIRLSEFSSTASEVMSFLPDNVIPSTISLPETFSVAGSFAGSATDFETAMVLRSSLGNAVVVADLKPVAGNELQAYHVKAELENFNVGKFLKQEDRMGFMNLGVTVDGEGLILEEMNAAVTADVRSFELMGYDYRDAVVNGTIKDQSFIGDISIDNEAIAFDFKGEAGLDRENPGYNFNLDIRYMDLQALRLYNSDLKFAGKITGDFTGDNLSNLDGHVSVAAASVAVGNRIVTLDTIDLLAVSDTGVYNWKFRSPVINASYAGTSSAAIGIPLLINHIRYYSDLQSYRKSDTLGSQQFDFEIKVHDNDNLLPLFISGLDHLSPFQVSGSFDSQSKKVNLLSSPVHGVYSGITVDSLVFFAESDPEKLNYSLTAGRIQRDTLFVSGIAADGFLQHDSVTWQLAVKPNQKQTDFLIGGSLSSAGSHYRLHLDPEKIIIRDKPWSVNPENFIQFGNSGMLAKDMKIYNDGSYLMVESTSESAGSPLEFTFKDFDLSLLANIADTTGQMMTGIVNGNFLLEDAEQAAFRAALDVKGLSLLGQHYGDLELQANNKSAGVYEVKMNLSGAGNRLALDGYYGTTSTENALHFDADIDSADFSMFEPFAKPYLSDLAGSVKGKLSIRGTTSAPSLNGWLRFDSARFKVSYTNSLLLLGNEPVVFDDSGIQFNNFSIYDPAGSKALVSGNLYTTNYVDYEFALDASAKDFTAMNSTAEARSEYYGLVKLDFITRIRGSMSNPSVDIRLKLKEGTNFNYIYQRFDTSFNSEEGLVEFIDMDQRLELLLQPQDSLLTMLSGYDVTIIAEVDDKSEFSIVVDALAGDKLTVSGTGTLNYEINPSGKMSLAGRYEISAGSYNLTLYNLVRKKFVIDKGSYINWTGNLYDADIDITGHLDVRTAPLPLIGSQSGGTSDEQTALYKNPLDFDVYLMLKNKLLAPDISFDIQLDKRDEGALDGIVDNKLLELRKTEGEMNKQVFALMLFGAFVAEDPMASTGAAEYINDVAKSSVSSLMSSQLNRLSSEYIKGIDLSFDLKSVTDYSSGVEEEKTQMNVGMREQLFNDRLLIYVGTNFDIGGSEAFSVKPSDISGDFSLEYLVRADGRVRTNLSRKNTYEGIFEGQAIETSLALIYNRDYNSLQQLFASRREAAAEKRRKKAIEGPEEQ